MTPVATCGRATNAAFPNSAARPNTSRGDSMIAPACSLWLEGGVEHHRMSTFAALMSGSEHNLTLTGAWRSLNMKVRVTFLWAAGAGGLLNCDLRFSEAFRH